MERTYGPQLTANVARQQMMNASFFGSGALGTGDRGGWQSVSMVSSNPYNSNDFVTRWRQYVQLYETSWEARKIVRIPVEDALRKEWIVEGISEDISKGINLRLKQMNFLHTLARSLMLERLLGGCLTFMGLESAQDDAGKSYNPTEGSNVRFFNAIPLSRISRMTWDTNPLSEHYMRPIKYLINGCPVHVSRCLVWDGDPLFDPYDFALTNFRANLAGFGPSKLAPIWDDIMYAIGTRQAVYQLVQTNNAIIAAVTGLQDLKGKKGSKAIMEKLQELVDNLSVYRAALIDGERVNITQSAASFGSVPELVITFIQVLAAASDIPATRFLGQAPGGLNATGESDLENYYNVIDSFQMQRIEPALRRVYDVMGYAKYPDRWSKEREKLEFKFPPLWNLDELEEADRASKILDNIMKARDGGVISDEHIVEELNLKSVFSVTLDDTDLQLLDDTGLNNDQQVNPEEQLNRLRNSVYFQNADKMSLLISAVGGNPTTIDRDQFMKGFAVEQEHYDTVDGNEETIAKITIDHLKEDPKYYDKLERVENSFDVDLEKAIKEEEYLYLQKPKPLPKSRLGDLAFRSEYDKKYSEWRRAYGDAVKKVALLEKKVQNSIYLERLPGATDAQRHAGNYKKHHLRLHGLDFSIENPMGSERTGVDKGGKPWASILPAHYGYVRRTEGADGDHVDAYIGPFEESELVFIVDQNDADTGKFDEHKCIFGALSLTQAKELYLKGFSDGRGEQRIRAITPSTIDGFKQWLKEGDTTRPFVNKGFKEEDHPRADDGKFETKSGSHSADEKEGAIKEKEERPKPERTKQPTKTDEEKKKESDEKFVKAMEGKSESDVAAFTEARSRGIAVPPAWTNLWVNPDKDGSLMAKGVDAKGRVQYIYSALHKNEAAAKKFNRLKAFTRAYDGIMSGIKKDMEHSDEAKVLYLISHTGFRIGGSEDTGADKKAYGASTLLGTHVTIEDNKAVFNFVGKKGVQQNHVVDDPVIVDMVKSKAGKEEPLFNTSPEKVRSKLKSYNPDFVVKDFRTYVATDTALSIVEKVKEKPSTMKELQSMILKVATEVSKKLGNAPQESRDSYIDPTVFKPWKEALNVG